jgi:hypothetical protein
MAKKQPKLRQLLQQLAQDDPSTRPFILPALASITGLRGAESLLEEDEFTVLIKMLTPMHPWTEPGWWPPGLTGRAFLTVQVNSEGNRRYLTLEGLGFLKTGQCRFCKKGPLNKYLSIVTRLFKSFQGFADSTPVLIGVCNSRNSWRGIFEATGQLVAR